MILGAQIGLFLWAVFILVTGKLVLGKDRVVRGTPARLLALFGFLPLPLGVLATSLYVTYQASQGQPPQPDEFSWPLIGIHVVIILGCLALIHLIGAGLAGPANPPPAEEHKG